MNEVLVLGGGPAGLGAAWWAARAGHEVTLLERAEGPGGLAASFTLAGVRVDHGSHRLHPATDPRVLAELRGLLGDDLQRRARNGRIRLAGRWVAFPLSARDLATALPPSFAAGAARDTVLAPLRRPRADTFADVLRAGLGTTLCERFYFPYARKIWGVDPDQLAGEQARRRVRAGSPAKLARRLVRRERPFFYYPRTGFGAIPERLAEAAAGAGADLRFGCAVERIEPGLVVAGGRRFQAGMVFSTIPLPVLAGLGGGPATDLEFRALTLVYLVLRTGRYTPYDAHYLPEAFTPVSRLSEPRNYRDGDDPPDRTVLCAEVPCTVGDGTWTAGPQELAELVTDGLRAAGLPDPPVIDVAVRRLPRAYPVYRVGYEAGFAALDAWAAGQAGLVTFGRQGLFAHDNTHHALVMALDAVHALGPGGAWDGAAWGAARRRFAAHVVED